MPIEQPHTRQDVSEGAFLAALAYVGPLCILSLFLQPKNKYTKYHTKQGLVLFTAEVGIFIGGLILFWITGLIFGNFINAIFNIHDNFLNFIFNILLRFTFWGAYLLVALVFSTIGFYNAWGGNLWQMPLLWYYARRLKF